MPVFVESTKLNKDSCLVNGFFKPQAFSEITNPTIKAMRCKLRKATNPFRSFKVNACPTQAQRLPIIDQYLSI